MTSRAAPFSSQLRVRQSGSKPARMSDTRLPKTKFHPYRILTYALFAKHDWIRRHNDGSDVHVEIQHTPFRVMLRCTPERFRSYLEWLEDQGYIRDLDMSRGESSFAVRLPDSHNWE